MDFANKNLDSANFSHANLSLANLAHANLSSATLTDADFTGAEVRGANFSKYFYSETGITLTQLYSTASYQAHNLTGIGLRSNNLAGGNFAGLNLTNANFSGAMLTGADFTESEVRGASFDRRGDNGGFGTGITLVQLYSTASYQAKELSGISLSGNNLTDGNFAHQNLTNASFYGATLSGADFTDAVLHGANFSKDSFNGIGTGITLEQLYSTASYQAHDLTGISLGDGNLSGSNFAGQNLTNSSFGTISFSKSDFAGWGSRVAYATLTGADFTGADSRGALYLDFTGATTTNLLRPDGHVDGLDLSAGGLLVVRNYYGDPVRTNPFDGTPTPLPPIPITVDQHLAMGPGGVLRMVFDGGAWGSTISFAPGIPVTLGGVLELTYAPDVNLAGEIGRTIDVFNWTGVNPTGAFTISSPYTWDLSKLYTTGEVTLSNVPGLLVLGDFNRDGQLTATDIQAMLTALTDLHSYEAAKGLSDAALVLLGDMNGDHAVTNADIQSLLDLLAGSGGGGTPSVPEPSSHALAAMAFAALSVFILRNRLRPQKAEVTFQLSNEL